MTNQISTFNFKSNPVRIETVQNEPYFCLTDVCSALAINNANSSRFRLNEEGVHKMYTLTNGGKQELLFINEPNLYRIIFRSNKAEAVEFQNWVFEEVLPQIRKTGKYTLQQTEQNRHLAEERKIALELPERQWLGVVSVWYALHHNLDLLKTVEKPLRALGSPLADQALEQRTEYDILLGVMQRIMLPLFADFKADQTERPHHHQALKTLREYRPHGLGRIARL